MAIVTKEILVGAGDLLLAPGNATGLPTVGAGDAGKRLRSKWRTLDGTGTPAWKHVGATQDGLEISYEPDYGEVEIDQQKDAALIFNQGLRISINTNLVQGSLYNLMIAWGYHSRRLVDSYTGTATDEYNDNVPANLLGAGDSALRLANPDDEVVERQLVVLGNAPKPATGQNSDRYKERIYWGRRVVSMDTSSHSLRKNEATVFPVSFRLLPDPTFSGSEYGVIIDRVVTD